MMLDHKSPIVHSAVLDHETSLILIVLEFINLFLLNIHVCIMRVCVCVCLSACVSSPLVRLHCWLKVQQVVWAVSSALEDFFESILFIAKMSTDLAVAVVAAALQICSFETQFEISYEVGLSHCLKSVSNLPS